MFVIRVVSRFQVPARYQRALLSLVICSVLVILAGGNVLAQPAGEVWQQSTGSASFLSRYSHASAVFDSGNGDAMWVIGGNSVSSGLFNDIWYSRDGITWIAATNSAGFPARADHTSVVFHDAMWVVGGYGGARTFNDVWKSTDGTIWKEVTGSASFPIRYGHTSVVFNDKIWVIGGSGDSGNYYNDVWYSSDGVTWHSATSSAQFPPRYSHTSVVFDNKIWVIGGYSAQSGNLNDVWFSSDGTTWVEANSSVSWAPRGDHTSLVFDHRIWVMGGSGDSGNFQDAWYSTDGKQWTQAAGVTFFPARTCHSSVIFEKKAWVLGGWGDTGNLNDVWFTTIPVLPEITAISPVSAFNISTESVINLEGSNFMPGATVLLNRTGQADIRGMDITIPGADHITFQADLTGKLPGKYTVVVTNPDGEKGILANGFVILSAGADSVANSTFNGLTLSGCTSPQKVTIDTETLPSVLQEDGTVLEILPPAVSGFRKIVLHALNGTKFTRSVNATITGLSDGASMETREIIPAGFTPETGLPVSFRYTMALASYPCNGLIRTTLWEEALPDDKEAFQRIAEENDAHYHGTAFTARITRTHFPSPDNLTMYVRFNTSGISVPGGRAGNVFVQGIADDKMSGTIFPTSRIGNDSGPNPEYLQADTPGKFSTFGISSLSGNANLFQPVLLGNPGGDDPGEPGQNPMVRISPSIPVPAVTPDPGQTATLYQDNSGATTEAVILQSTDCLARVNIGKGTLVNLENGTSVSSVTMEQVLRENLPPLPQGSPSTFAGRAYEFLPDGAVFSPAIPVSFIAPHIPSGQHFSVKTFDRTSRTWHDIPSRYDTQTATVTAEVSHFCIIALFSEMGGLTPDPSGSLVTAGQSNPEDSPAQFLLRSPALVFPMIMDLIVKNGFVILGILIITGAIFLRTRKPRRYRVRYEK